MSDVVIIGSGAGGAPLALRLSEAGFDVLVLEKGPRYDRSEYMHDEVSMALRPEFFIPSTADEPHVLVDGTASYKQPQMTTLGWIACCVGGGTAHMGGCLYRFHPDDYRLQTRLGPFESIVDWPYTYHELEPYYSQAEWEMGVSGASGFNPFEGFRSKRFPMPPLASHPLARDFERACSKLGIHPFPTPRAMNSRPYGGRPACTYCDFCAGYGCPVGARGSTQESLLPRAENTGNCEIRANAMAREIIVGPHGRVSGCIYVDQSGIEHEVKARLLCVCCSAVESARLLLLSKSHRFPDGLANGSGLVGRNLQFHVGSAGRARFNYANHSAKSLRHRNWILGRSVMDYYFLADGISEFPKGGLLRFDLTQTHPIAAAQRIARGGPGGLIWGEELKTRLRRHFCEYREVEFEAFQDFIPNEQTFMELDACIKDKWGLPVARIHLANPDHHRLAGEWLRNRGLEILDAMGADELIPGSFGYTSNVMVHGTCRAGADPTNSVLNEFCQAHEVPNLFVVDGSFMPTCGGAPSTLTIVANSFRVADFIQDRAVTGDV